MEPKIFNYDRLVKSEDLNHHQTLFAGRCSEWFVEAGFIAVASVLPASNIVCVQIHGLTFTSPLKSGDIACFESKIVYTGRTSVIVYVAIKDQKNRSTLVRGFITFVHVNQNGKSLPHGLSLELTNPEDIELNQEAKLL
jgi:acyl-CoA hydrolase